MELFPKIVTGLKPLTNLAKNFVLPVQLGSEYASENASNILKHPTFFGKIRSKFT